MNINQHIFTATHVLSNHEIKGGIPISVVEDYLRRLLVDKLIEVKSTTVEREFHTELRLEIVAMTLDEFYNIVQQERWKSLNIAGMEYNRPREGDLIYLGSDSSEFSINYFEIAKVNYDKFFFQMGKTFSYSLTCVAYTGAYEPITTGIDLIDTIGYDNTTEINLGTNTAVKEKEITLRVFDEKNPFDF